MYKLLKACSVSFPKKNFIPPRQNLKFVEKLKEFFFRLTEVKYVSNCGINTENFVENQVQFYQENKGF